MATGENNQAFLKITDMTRLMALCVVALHLYYYGYWFLYQRGLTYWGLDLMLLKIRDTGLFEKAYYSKALGLGLLSVSLLGLKARKQPGYTYTKALLYLSTGLTLYWGSSLLVKLYPLQWYGYMGITLMGFLLFLVGGTQLSRILQHQFNWDHPFNDEQESFPQQSEKISNAYSVNLPAEHTYRGRRRPSWINIINPFRGLLVLGTPGAGKSYFVIRHVITQHLEKGFSMFVYDFKYDDLTKLVYNTYLSSLEKDHAKSVPGSKKGKKKPSFYLINFDDLSRSHRCNPLRGIPDKENALEAARTILLGLNREWIKRQGDFFVESAINFLTAIILFLSRYQGGEFCSLPHAIELLQTDYDRLLSILRVEAENEPLINAFVNAYLNGAMEQLEGQLGSTKIALGRLASPRLYYVLSGHDFDLDLNNPDDPKILCLGNNPQKSQVYGAVLSLFANRLFKVINQPGKLPCSLVFDEFPTIYLRGVEDLMATARSSQVATTLGLQDLTQLRKEYGRELADVMMNLPGNIISGQVTGDTARHLSERIGKILQLRPSFSINSSDTSHSYARQLELALPISKISTLSSGEFVGYVADNPQERIQLKAFHATIKNDHKALSRQQSSFQPLPLIRQVAAEHLQKNYETIRQQAREIVEIQLDRMYRDPQLCHLIISRPKNE